MEDYLNSVVKPRFLLLLTETDEVVRDEAKERFALNKNPDIRKLGEIADAIFNVVSGKAGPSELESAVRASRSLQDTEYWCGLAEESAKVVLKYALSLDDKKPEKLELVKYGLRFAGVAIGPAWPISEETMGLVKRAKKDYPELARMVDIMISVGSPHLPERRSRPFVGNAAGEHPKREKRPPVKQK